jgi:hypothetical protein
MGAARRFGHRSFIPWEGGGQGTLAFSPVSRVGGGAPGNGLPWPSGTCATLQAASPRRANGVKCEDIETMCGLPAPERQAGGQAAVVGRTGFPDTPLMPRGRTAVKDSRAYRRPEDASRETQHHH